MSRADRRAFFERSLADLDEEHAAGDLSDEDHERLTADYRRRLDEVDGSASAAGPKAPPRRRPGMVAASIAFVVVVAVAAGVLVAQAAGRREPGQSATGLDPRSAVGGDTTTSTSLAVADALAACFDLDGSDALDCYINYTRSNPDDADGFLYFGLFSINQGITANSQELLEGGETFLRRALQIDPGNLQARANLAVVLERTGHPDEAREELSHLEGVDLPDDVQQLVDFVESNLAAASTTATTAAP